MRPEAWAEQRGKPNRGRRGYVYIYLMIFFDVF